LLERNRKKNGSRKAAMELLHHLVLLLRILKITLSLKAEVKPKTPEMRSS